MSTITIKALTDYLESVAPLDLQEDYDNAGLLVGDTTTEIDRALISLDVTPEVVNEAVDKGCKLIIAHHPVIFRGLKRLTGATYVERAVITAIRHGIAIYAIHTNLDNVLHNGVNGEIAGRLGLINIEVLSPLESSVDKGHGAGVIGAMPESVTEDAFLAHLSETMKLQSFRHTHLTGKMVGKVAVCGGSGSFLLPKALVAGAQVYVSADFKYHEFFDAEGQILIADIGHYESERFTMDLIADLIRRKFPTFAAQLTTIVTNPITYYP